jgi:hypothetical protein
MKRSRWASGRAYGLGLGRGAVDLVADHDVGEHPAGAELELAGVLVEDRDAGDVGGQQVRRELDPSHGRVDAAGQRLAQLGLADAGDVLDEQVALGEQHDQGCVDDVGLAGDHALDVVANRSRHPVHDVQVGRLPGKPSRHVVRPLVPTRQRCSPPYVVRATYRQVVVAGTTTTWTVTGLIRTTLRASRTSAPHVRALGDPRSPTSHHRRAPFLPTSAPPRPREREMSVDRARIERLAC